MYEGLLTEKMPEGVTVVGFAEDLAIVGRSWKVDHLEDIVNESLGVVHKWMSDHQTSHPRNRSRHANPEK